MKYWVVEHPVRGVFVRFERMKPKFRWSILRSQGYRFYSVEAAETAASKMNLKGVTVLEMEHRRR